jgi:hypothetical protein
MKLMLTCLIFIFLYQISTGSIYEKPYQLRRLSSKLDPNDTIMGEIRFHTNHAKFCFEKMLIDYEQLGFKPSRESRIFTDPITEPEVTLAEPPTAVEPDNTASEASLSKDDIPIIVTTASKGRQLTVRRTRTRQENESLTDQYSQGLTRQYSLGSNRQSSKTLIKQNSHILTKMISFVKPTSDKGMSFDFCYTKKYNEGVFKLTYMGNGVSFLLIEKSPFQVYISLDLEGVSAKFISPVDMISIPIVKSDLSIFIPNKTLVSSKELVKKTNVHDVQTVVDNIRFGFTNQYKEFYIATPLVNELKIRNVDGSLIQTEERFLDTLCNLLGPSKCLTFDYLISVKYTRRYVFSIENLAFNRLTVTNVYDTDLYNIFISVNYYVMNEVYNARIHIKNFKVATALNRKRLKAISTKICRKKVNGGVYFYVQDKPKIGK